MNTPSHLIMTAAWRRWRGKQDFPLSAAILGSIAPDLPLFALSFGGAWYFQSVLGWSGERTFRHMYNELFYHDSWWISLHNFLHSPTLLCLMLVAAWALSARLPRLCHWLRWFLLACLLHSVVDIATHNDDGPLLFFPFEWSVRFSSPVSYWDHRHFSREFMWFEGMFDLALLGYLCWSFGRQKAADEAAAA